jgi:hypothetical protein
LAQSPRGSQTGGQGLFRADDNLESVHGCAALRQLYVLIYSGKVEGCSLQTFEAATGLRLTDQDGTLREDLPAITTFLNRLLALTIALQNTLFEVFEDLLRTRIEGAIASGSYDHGVETVTAESLTVTGRKTIYTHPQGGAETQVFTILRRERNKPLTLPKALDLADSESRSRLLVNRQSGRAAVQVPTTSLMLDDGAVERRVRLMRPMEHPAISVADLAKTQWREAERAEFIQAWETELAALPEFTDSTLHIVTGLLLPIWKRLPHDSMRVTGCRPMRASASSAGWCHQPGWRRHPRTRFPLSARPTLSRPCSMAERWCSWRTPWSCAVSG